MKRQLLSLLTILMPACLAAQGVTTDANIYLENASWDNASAWSFQKMDGATTGSIGTYAGLNDDGLEINYSFPSGGGWVTTGHTLDNYTTDHPVVFFIYAGAGVNDLEIKFIDSDGSVFGVKITLVQFQGEWKNVTVYPDNTEYWWGGNSTFDTPAGFSLAVSGSTADQSVIYIDEIGIGKTGLPSTILSTIDPNATLEGTGFLQRRDAEISPEDPLVLEYLKELQDRSSTSGQLLASTQGGTEAQTFNNALAALAFIVKNEKERAEMILDFYQSATDSANTDIHKQNFFYLGKARGFYQQFVMSSGRDESNSDRWIGDMAWLLIAGKYYEKTYSSDRYTYLITLISDLLKSYYKDAGTGGYIQSGWRKGDSYLHEASGHHEGNIDCYVVMKLCGDHNLAHRIKLWVDSELTGKNSLPLDLYTWRTLAFGALDPSYVSLLNIPEFDYRFRKVIEVNGSQVMGMFSNPDITVNNFWNDGTGHIACAFQAFGDVQRGYFYANQLDPLLISEYFSATLTHTLPYTLNQEGGYSWVNVTEGFVSDAAWYILAKNGCNPFQSENFEDSDNTEVKPQPAEPTKLILTPNPFSGKLEIGFFLSNPTPIHLSLLDMNGKILETVYEGNLSAGAHHISYGNNHMVLSEGLYLVRLIAGSEVSTGKIIHSVH